MNSSAAPDSQQVPPAVIHIDLDGIPEILKREVPAGNADVIYETGVPRFLDLFEAVGLRATFFLIANSLDHPRKRELVQQILRRGHEIASHSLTHPNLWHTDRAGKQREIAGSREKIQQMLSVRVNGFRAPGYCIDPECLDLLSEAGYAWDASVFPNGFFAQRMNRPAEQLRAPHRPRDGSPLVCFPMPDYRPFPLPFNPSYALQLGVWYFRAGLKNFRRKQLPLVLLFHLIDLADPLPAEMINGWKSRYMTLSNVGPAHKAAACRQMLAAVREQFRIVPTSDLLADFQRLPLPVLNAS